MSHKQRVARRNFRLFLASLATAGLAATAEGQQVCRQVCEEVPDGSGQCRQVCRDAQETRVLNPVEGARLLEGQELAIAIVTDVEARRLDVSLAASGKPLVYLARDVAFHGRNNGLGASGNVQVRLPGLDSLAAASGYRLQVIARDVSGRLLGAGASGVFRLIERPIEDPRPVASR